MTMHTKTEAMTGTAIVTRATVEEIVACRDRALALYAEAYDALAAADAAVKAARDMAGRASPGINGYNYQHEEEIKRFDQAIALPERDFYLKTARKLTDINCWAYIIERTDLERLMDKQAKDKLREQMKFVPEKPKHRYEVITEEEAGQGLPEITVGNIYATLDRFAADAGMIFMRGLANAFSKLDRRFRSHDGFKIGGRVILTYAFSDLGHLNYGAVRDTLIDIERVFAVLDGKTEASFTSALRALEHDRRGYGGPQQSYVETDYFRIRGFKNGNAHLWFTRDDLVEKVNKKLAEYYGEVIGDGQTQEADPLGEIKTTPARYFGFYPTPDDLAAKVVNEARVIASREAPQLRILEPSAGTGNIARRCVNRIEELDNWAGGREQNQDRYRFDNLVDCVEIQPHLAAALEAEGIYGRVWTADFLHLSPEQTGLYDRIVMNPPFDRERDIDHVNHALQFLKPEGRLLAIMSAGTEFRETRKSIAFREKIAALHGQFVDLPAGSFSEVGTYVNTCLLILNADGTPPRYWGRF